MQRCLAGTTVVLQHLGVDHAVAHQPCQTSLYDTIAARRAAKNMGLSDDDIDRLLKPLQEVRGFQRLPPEILLLSS